MRLGDTMQIVSEQRQRRCDKIVSAAFSAIMRLAALVFPETIIGTDECALR